MSKEGTHSIVVEVKETQHNTSCQFVLPEGTNAYDMLDQVFYGFMRFLTFSEATIDRIVLKKASEIEKD